MTDFMAMALASAQERQRAAAERDVPIARELLRRNVWNDQQRCVAYQRWQKPDWTWQQIGESLGLTKDQAAKTFARMAERVGLR